MCSEPLMVGGGVSIEYTSPRGAERSKAYTPESCHEVSHFRSRPASDGFSGIIAMAATIGPPVVSVQSDTGAVTAQDPQRTGHAHLGEHARRERAPIDP